MAVFKIKEGDTSPALSYALTPKTVTLSGATVVFNMMRKGGTVKISGASATITDNGDGTSSGTPTVRYDWTAADTNTAGVYRGEFQVTYSDSSIETFPNDGYIEIRILKDIA